MATAYLERSDYEVEREKRLGLIPYTPGQDYDLIMTNHNGRHEYGRYLGTLIPVPPSSPGNVANGASFNGSVNYKNGGNGGMNKYSSGQQGFLNQFEPSVEIDGYTRASTPYRPMTAHSPSMSQPISGHASTNRPMTAPNSLAYSTYATSPPISGPNADRSLDNSYSFKPISASNGVVRPMTIHPGQPRDAWNSTRGTEAEYTGLTRPTSAMASLGSYGEAAGHNTNTHPVCISQVFKVGDVPIEQLYELTKLKKSAVRTDDQIIPRPTEIDVAPLSVNKPFPAEHPFSSHTQQKAIFPKFAESPDDPVRGADARKVLPKSHLVPSQPNDVLVLHKIMGHGVRHEVHVLPPGDSQKKPLHWPGDHGFDQKVKVHGGRQQYYPSPPKTYVPNLEKRRPELQISERTANTLLNLEREQWMTTYDRANTGYGSIHAMALDNYDDKVQKYRCTGDVDDNLYPRSIPPFDPPRPVEGRIARGLTPRPAPQIPDSDWRARPSDEPRKLTVKELEEIRFHYGHDYYNYPEGKELDKEYTDDTGEKLYKYEYGLVTDEGEAGLTDDLKLEYKYKMSNPYHQGSDLEQQKLINGESPAVNGDYLTNDSQRLLPSEILDTELMYKYKQPRKYEQPQVIDNEYQDIFNARHSLKRSKTVQFSNNVQVATGAGFEPIRISSAPMNGTEDEYERRRIDADRRRREEEKRRREDDARRRECEFFQREEMLRNQAYQGQTINDVQATSAHAQYQPINNTLTYPSRPGMQRSLTFDQMPPAIRRSYPTTLDDMFVSKSSNYMPSGIKNQEMRSSYQSQFPTAYSLNFKDDPRFNWRLEMGTPRPQTKLLDIQNSFSKTKVIRDFHRKFPELHADVRAHVVKGKRHVFDGTHALTYRGN